MAIWNALRALEWDTDITPEEITPAKISELKLEIEACTPDQSSECIAILEAAIGRAQWDAATGLQGLRDNIEVQSATEYSIDGLIEHVSDDQKAKAFLELYKSVIVNDLATIYGEKYNLLSDTAKNTIQLVFWNVIQSQLGFKGAMNAWQGMLGSLTEGFTGLLWETEQEATGSILTESLRAKWDFFWKLEETPWIPAWFSDDVSGVIDIVESLIWKEADNLNDLLEATATMSVPDKERIFENPLIVQAVMKDGKYTDHNFNIDITTSPINIVLGDTQNREEIQSTFLTEMKEDTSKLGGRIDRLRNLKEKADDFLWKFGMEGWLDGLFESLYKIPVLGVFFKMIFGDFFDKFDSLQSVESVTRVIEALENRETRASLAALQDTFLPKFSENYSDKNETALGKLFAKNPPLSDNFYSSLSDDNKFFSILEEAKISFGNSDFWDQVFMGKWTTPQTSIIHNKLLSLRILENGEVTEQQIITALNSLSVEELIIAESTDGNTAGNEWDTEAIIPDGTIPPVSATEVIPTTTSLSDQITALNSFPATLTLESGDKIEVSAFDATNSSITLNEKTFTLSLTGAGMPITIKDLTISTWIWKLTYINPVDQSETDVEITSEDIEKMLVNLLETWNFSQSWNTEQGIPFTLDIK